jgi:Sigma-70, region 4
MSSRREADFCGALDGLARRAAEGPRSLSELVREVQHPMCRLAPRFLGNPDDAQDACQEILSCDEVRISCTYGMLLCLPRPQRAAYLLADVLGLTDGEGAEILDCSRDAFRQRVSRARRTLRFVIDNRCGLVDPANPCRCGRQIAAGEAAGVLDRKRLPLARHARQYVRAWIEPVAKQLDFDRRDRRALPLRPLRPLRRAGRALGRSTGPFP